MTHADCLLLNDVFNTTGEQIKKERQDLGLITLLYECLNSSKSNKANEIFNYKLQNAAKQERLQSHQNIILKKGLELELTV